VRSTALFDTKSGLTQMRFEFKSIVFVRETGGHSLQMF
jgi:hypothetical protein